MGTKPFPIADRVPESVIFQIALITGIGVVEQIQHRLARDGMLKLRHLGKIYIVTPGEGTKVNIAEA